MRTCKRGRCMKVITYESYCSDKNYKESKALDDGHSSKASFKTKYDAKHQKPNNQSDNAIDQWEV